MTSGSFRFDLFCLDPVDRQLKRDDVRVELNARYFDALALLVREAGTLVSKDRFLAEVWRGVPVTDEALTQCIKTLRRALADDAARPRFIETVPKHGYRFIAPVEALGSAATPAANASSPAADHGFDARQFVLLGLAGTIGAGVAGLIGGLFYGFAGAAQPLAPGLGAASVLLVLVCLTILAAVIGGAGVSFGIAAARIAGRPWPWAIAGGAAGGLIVGAFGRLLGLDAFHLLLGRSPGDITGAPEGMLLGGAVGAGTWLAHRQAGAASVRRGVVMAGLVGAASGVAIVLLGGRLMAGSLDLLARSFPGSRLRLDQIGAAFGEAGFGPISQLVTGGLEGALFGGCIVGAMMIARRGLSERL